MKLWLFRGFLSDFWCFVLAANPSKTFCLTWRRKEARMINITFLWKSFISAPKSSSYLIFVHLLSVIPIFEMVVFRFGLQCVSISFHCEKKHFNFRVFCQFEVWFLHWKYFPEESIYCAVIMEILSRLSLTVWLRSHNNAFSIGSWREKLEDELISPVLIFFHNCIKMS